MRTNNPITSNSTNKYNSFRFFRWS